MKIAIIALYTWALPTLASTGSAAAYDVKGDAAAAAAAGRRPATARPPQLRPPAAIRQGPAAPHVAQPRLESLENLIKTQWKQLDSQTKADVVEQFKRLSPEAQNELVGNLKKAHADRSAIKTLSHYLPGKKHAKGYVPKDAIAKKLYALGELPQTVENQLTIMTELTPLVRDNFDKLTPAQKQVAVLLYASLPEEYHESMRSEWHKKNPAIAKHFEAEHQKFINARKAEGR
jgi:hypothetical protein